LVCISFLNIKTGHLPKKKKTLKLIKISQVVWFPILAVQLVEFERVLAIFSFEMWIELA
jgi:hypothetical protein